MIARWKSAVNDDRREGCGICLLHTRDSFWTIRMHAYYHGLEPFREDGLLKDEFCDWIEADHIDRKGKVDSISNMIHRGGYTEEQFQDERRKCNYICVVCHKDKTRDENRKRKGLPIYRRW